MAEATEQDQQLTDSQKIWGAQVTLAAMATLWQSLPDDQKQELIEEVLETYDDAQVWAYTVLYVESLGFDVAAPLVPVEDYEPEANTEVALGFDGDGELKTGLYL